MLPYYTIYSTLLGIIDVSGRNTGVSGGYNNWYKRNETERFHNSFMTDCVGLENMLKYKQILHPAGFGMRRNVKKDGPEKGED